MVICGSRSGSPPSIAGGGATSGSGCKLMRLGRLSSCAQEEKTRPSRANRRRRRIGSLCKEHYSLQFNMGDAPVAAAPYLQAQLHLSLCRGQFETTRFVMAEDRLHYRGGLVDDLDQTEVCA